MVSLVVKEALSSAVRNVQADPNVVGIDYGFAYVSGRRTNKKSIRYHVQKKMPPAELSTFNLIAKEIRGIRTDVVVASYATQSGHRRKIDPVKPGVSIGNLQSLTTGTLGCFVRITESRRDGVLSNWHVLVGSPNADRNSSIIQPGPAHLISEQPHFLGKLYDWINLDHGYDAAIAVLDENISFNYDFMESGITLSNIKQPNLGDILAKVGAITGLTYGIVEGVEGKYKIDYSAYGEVPRWMNGFRLGVHSDYIPPSREISLSGDSGAVWYDPNQYSAVGLHFGGEDRSAPLNEYALAHSMEDVLKKLSVFL